MVIKSTQNTCWRILRKYITSSSSDTTKWTQKEQSTYKGIYMKDCFIKVNTKFVLEAKLKIKLFINARFQDTRSHFVTINETPIILGNVTLHSSTLHLSTIRHWPNQLYSYKEAFVSFVKSLLYRVLNSVKTWGWAKEEMNQKLFLHSRQFRNHSATLMKLI